MTSAKVLYDYFEGNGEFCPAFVCDLFGRFNWTTTMNENVDDTITLFMGLYKGLYLMGVTHTEIHRCFKRNKLDELIHKKYIVRKSGYYKDFCERNIKIGKTYCDDSESDNDREPFIFSTIQPLYSFDSPIMNSVYDKVSQISQGTLDEVILRKLNEYKIQDKNNKKVISSNDVSIEDIKKLMVKQENKCYICGDVVITSYWQPNCLYQFTLDRIDNKLPHNRNNVLICCYYCNCYGWQYTYSQQSDDNDYDNDSDEDDNEDIVNLHRYKLCPNACHTIKRTITRTKNNVSKEEIKKLLLR